MIKAREIQWEREGNCIRCTSHKLSAGNGYVRIYRNGKYDTIPRLILIRRHKKINDGFLARHTCDNRWCINPDHILIGTYKDNASDMISRGRDRSPSGEKHHNSRLSVKDVEKIRSSTGLLRVDADKYGVSVATVGDIRHGRTWKNP